MSEVADGLESSCIIEGVLDMFSTRVDEVCKTVIKIVSVFENEVISCLLYTSDAADD